MYILNFCILNGLRLGRCFEALILLVFKFFIPFLILVFYLIFFLFFQYVILLFCSKNFFILFEPFQIIL